MPLSRLAKKFDQRSRLYATFCLGVIFIAVYLTTNHLTLWGPWQMSLYSWEKAIPFLPWTVFVYLTTFPQIILAVWLLARRDLGRTLAGLLTLMFIHGLIFFIFPTAYPRPEILPANTAEITRWFYRLLTVIDTPQNCFPSQHVALCVFAALALFRKNPATGLIFALWTLVIIVSTLTLKQHYFLDILGGILTAVLIYFWAFRYIKNI